MHQLIVAISICLSLLTPSVAYAKWTRMTTEHFVFVGDASEQRISEVATRLEVFREVIGRAFARPTPSSMPTVVFVFKNDKSFTPFKPMFQGTPMAVAGVFGGSDELNCIAVNAEMDSEAYGVIFHEYAHFLIRNALGSVPLWANEGLAQFYETFETRDGGRSALIGMPSLKGLRDLQAANTLVPIQELLAVKTGSPVYNQGERRGVFFAEAWALVHYLMLGNPERVGQLQEYLAAVRQGQSSGQAFASVFGGDSTDLERELREYSRRLSLNVIQLKFDQKISAERAQAEVITEADAAGYLGELLYHFHREEDAKTYLREVLSGADAPGAAATLGLIEVRLGNDREGVPLLDGALLRAPELPIVQRSYALAMARRAERVGAAETLKAEARLALERALDSAPHDTAMTVALARLEIETGRNAPKAAALLREAVAAVPGMDEYRLLLARALVVQRDYAGATSNLGWLIARASQPETREAARELLAKVADAVNLARSAGATQAATPRPAGDGLF